MIGDTDGEDLFDERPPLAPGDLGGDRAQRPLMPARPAPEAKKPTNPFVSLVIGLVGFGAICLMLLLCTGGNLMALILTAVIFAFAALHYLLWGWWLGKAIRRQVQEEEGRDE